MTTSTETLPPDNEGNSEGAHFEELTLAAALGQFFHAPRATLRALYQVASAPQRELSPPLPTPEARPRRPIEIAERVTGRSQDDIERRAGVQLGLRLGAFLLAWWGTGILVNTPRRSEETALVAGLPFLVIGFLLWLGADLYGTWPDARQRKRLDGDAGETGAETENASDTRSTRLLVRALIFGAGLVASYMALTLNVDNQFTPLGFWAWIASVGVWAVALSPAGHGPGQWLSRLVRRVRGRRWRSGTMLALAAILILGAAFRLSNLDTVPPEMTSDHVEKILDSNGVLKGQHNIFFANNGGREPFQMYAMSFFSQLPGLGMNHFTLKLLSVLEGLAAILLLFWMGREVIGAENCRLGNWVGLALAGLVAASYWHTVLSRMGLRIVLTTGVTAMLLVFLARALRINRREDYVRAGLVLGFGLYTYQAVRMLPVVITVGVVLAVLFQARSGRQLGRYLVNYAALVLMAFVVFVPMFGYSLQYPDDFLRRTYGRLLGDDIITTTEEDGTITSRNATIQERLEAFSQNIPLISSNLRNTLLMFQWKGDVAWINGAPNAPAMDTISGAFMIVGLGAWLARMIRRRDVFDWLLPLALVIMLLPSALAIAYPVENPSHTRTSGALPAAYLFAALPLALLAESLIKMGGKGRGRVIAVTLVGASVLGSYGLNSKTYFEDHTAAYIDSSLPYSEAGRILRGFAESDGSYGNAFMIAYPYWWDHRALGIEAGRPDWPNGIVALDRVKGFLRAAFDSAGPYHYDPERDILFFYSAEDEATQAALEAWFPQGRTILQQSYQWDDQYKLYRVPALGQEAFIAWQTEE